LPTGLAIVHHRLTISEQRHTYNGDMSFQYLPPFLLFCLLRWRGNRYDTGGTTIKIREVSIV